MDSPPLTALAIHATDFSAQHKVNTVIGVKAGPIRLELAAKLIQPLWMREIGACEQIDALDLGPASQVVKGQVLAAGVGVGRMEVKVGGIAHAASLA